LGGRAAAWEAADGEDTRLEVGADISDLYAWMSPDGARVNLVLDISQAGAAGGSFRSDLQYVFHTASRATPTGPEGPHPVTILCSFDDGQMISCWAGGIYVNGDASQEAGLSSPSGRLRVFAGLRNDPFFMNKDGWDVFSDTVHRGNRAVYMWDAAGCPYFTPDRTQAVLNELKTSDERGSTGFDYYQSRDVQSIVLSIDKGLLTADGPILSVWASTNHGK
jgi:hypothetical protein